MIELVITLAFHLEETNYLLRIETGMINFSMLLLSMRHPNHFHGSVDETERKVIFCCCTPV
jgi:hypothetical protein